MLVALEGILQSENERILCLATDLTVNLACSLGRSICQYHMLDIVISLSCALSTCQVSIAVPCTTALNRILTNLGAMSSQKSEELCKAMVKANTICSILCAMQDYVDGSKPIEYFTEMASLLKTVLWRWPSFRYQVWSNFKLMDRIQNYCISNSTLLTHRVLQLCSALGITFMVILFIQCTLKLQFYLPFLFYH